MVQKSFTIPLASLLTFAGHPRQSSSLAIHFSFTSLHIGKSMWLSTLLVDNAINFSDYHVDQCQCNTLSLVMLITYWAENTNFTVISAWSRKTPRPPEHIWLPTISILFGEHLLSFLIIGNFNNVWRTFCRLSRPRGTDNVVRLSWDQDLPSTAGHRHFFNKVGRSCSHWRKLLHLLKGQSNNIFYLHFFWPVQTFYDLAVDSPGSWVTPRVTYPEEIDSVSAQYDIPKRFIRWASYTRRILWKIW